MAGEPWFTLSESFRLDEGGPKRLKVGMTTRGFDIRLDGQVLVRLKQSPGPDPVKTKLPDGSVLIVRMSNEGGFLQFDVTRDGRPLPGTLRDPESARKMGVAALGVAAFLTPLVPFVFGTPWEWIAGAGTLSAVMVTAATSATRGSPDALRVGAVAMIAAAIGSAVLCVGWTGRPKAALIPVVYAGVVWTMLKRAVATPAPGTPPARHPWLKTLVRF